MNKKEIKELVCKKLSNDLSFNEMQIRQETITDIANECRYPAALHHCDAAGR